MTLTGVDYPERIMRLGTLGEKAYFQNRKGLYDILMLNANLVEGFGSGVASLMLSLGKPFIVDPLTHAFAHGPQDAVMKKKDGKWETKDSIERLAGKYGELTAAKVGRQAIIPADLTDEVIVELCEKTVDFQANRLRSALQPDELKYLDGASLETLRPAAIICPYFYMPAVSWREWLPTNADLVCSCQDLQQESDIPRLAMLCLDRDLLVNGEAVDQIISKYDGLPVAGYCVWVSDRPETDMGVIQADNLKKMAAGLSGGGDRYFYKIYGGYFAALLWLSGASGFSFGPGYGEDRSVIPVGGGLPQPKYYLPPVHRRLDAALVQRMLPDTAELFYDDICDCPQCHNIVGQDVSNFDGYMETEEKIDSRGRLISWATQATKERSVCHYLYARDAEVKSVRDMDVGALRAALQQAFTDYRPNLGDEGLQHLLVWADML